jgi:hypothetical protein
VKRRRNREMNLGPRPALTVVGEKAFQTIDLQMPVRRPWIGDLWSTNQSTSKMKRYKSGGTNGIPSRYGRKSISVAAQARPRCDVVEARASVTQAVQPRIEETN